jgi:hypothetical protein
MYAEPRSFLILYIRKPLSIGAGLSELPRILVPRTWLK